MLEKTHAEVQFSFLEYQAVYSTPVVDSLKLYREMAAAVFRAFQEWNISLENVTHKQNPANLGEVSITFALPGGKIAFTVGLGAVHLLVTNPDWGEAETIAKVAAGGVSAVKAAAGVSINKQRANIGMHIRPKSGSIKDLVSSFVRVETAALSEPGIIAFGVSVYKEDSNWIVDASATHPGALFVKIDRSFSPAMTLDQIAVQLHNDEDKLLELLRLEID